MAAGRQGLLLPPMKAGQFTTALAGCVAQAAQDSQGTRGANATNELDAAPSPEHSSVVVSVTGTGIIVAHDLTHACCLKARVNAVVQGKSVRIVEQLSGNACRCRCKSSIKTAVGLGPGNYALSVNVSGDGKARTVHQQPIVIARPADR